MTGAHDPDPDLDPNPDTSLTARVRRDPGPAARWGAVMAVLVAVEAGALAAALLSVVASVVAALAWLVGGATGAGVPVEGVLAALDGARAAAEAVPTLLSRETIPNQGHRTAAGGPWTGTFLGLEPAHAWALRAALIYAYAFLIGYWLFRGYLVFRRHYRAAEWTPRDDRLDRFRDHGWGRFGLVVVVLFLATAAFAPALAPTTPERNLVAPCQHQVTYYDEAAGSVASTPVCTANLESASNGAGGPNVGPLSYDDYGRFHPFGTLPTPGKDLFTFLAAGARVSLFVGLLAMGIAGTLAVAFALVSAYYRGPVDLAAVVAGDSVMTLPSLLVLILVAATFEGHPLAEVYSGALVVALALGVTRWPFLWRAIRGPSLGVAGRTWIDAARSFGQHPATTMRRHMLPAIAGYLLVYGSMMLGGVLVATAALSFLNLGVQPPTPEWGRAISLGEPYVATQSWHVATIPGVLITLVVTGFNALGDGVRDALDPHTAAESGVAVAATGGDGG
ncbi:ABC transporter permease [Halobacteriales archaeon QS_1_68_17]|nr:MAG: ABC transporter permease [Halobacteriales archaeon QS_1_68_17]